MNNKETFTSESSRNWILIFSILLGLLLASTTVHAQAVSERVEFGPELTNDYDIKYFTVKEVNNKLYFKFLVLENRDHVDYTLESSSNGVDFYAVQLKEGFKSPNGVPLLYCYSVDLNVMNDKTYRVRRDSPNGPSYSSELEVIGVSQSLSAQK